MATNNSPEKNLVEKCSDFLDKFYNLPRKYYVLLVFLFPLISPKRFSFLWKENFINVFLKDFGVGIDKKPIQNLDYVFIILYIAIFLIVIGLFLYKKIKHNYIFSRFYQIILLVIGSVYFIYRSEIFFTNPFFPLKLANCHFFIFAYSDIVLLTLIIPIINIIGCIKAKLKKQESEPISQEIQGFIHDSPTEKGESTLAKTVIEKLLHTKSEDTAFSLGISGEWGTGKTSFLMLLEKELNEQAKEKHKNIVIIKFNPWNSTSPQAIITDFFDTFRSELGKYSAEIKHSLNDYSQKLVNTDGDVFSILKFIGNLFGEDKSIMQEQEKINEILRKINRQIFIFIDDLDRLDKNEVIEVIRLIRNSANFYNVFFIVAYDKGYIEEAIEQLSTHNKSFFLEKIFQLELHLPAYEYHHIADDLYEKLIAAIPFLSEKEEIKKFIETHPGLSLIIQNFRDVKRFVNSFSVVYNKEIEREVYFPDFFHIELLRFKYPLIYDLLKYPTKREYFFNDKEVSAISKYLNPNEKEKINPLIKN